MQLLPILLVAAVLAADGGLRLIDRPGWLTPLASSALVIGPVLLILALAWMRLAWCRRREAHDCRGYRARKIEKTALTPFF